MTAATTHPRVAILIFAESQARDLRRRGFSARWSHLLSLPSVSGAAEQARADVHWFCDRPARAPHAGVTVHRQRGRSFGERLENAVADLTERGYDRVVIVGRDCPQMAPADLCAAIDELKRNRLVIGPDHRGGCWLIGLHTADRARLAGIRWRCDTDAEELRARFAGDLIHEFAEYIDLDTAADLFLLARRFRGLEFSLFGTPQENASPPSNGVLVFIRRFLQLPPPLVYS